MDQLATWLVCGGSLLLTMFAIRRFGFYEGGRTVFVIVLLLAPCWMTISLPLLRADARSLSAFAMLVGLALHPYTSWHGPGWLFSDFCILAVIAAMITAQAAAHDLSPTTVSEPFREMAFPYFAGRIFIRSSRDIESLLPVINRCLLLLCAWSTYEAFAHRNPLEILLGRPWGGEGAGTEELDMVRWGLKRAYGPQTHAIYLGLTFALMLPWAIESAVQSWSGRGPAWWKAMPFIVLLGVVTTGSRAAQICSIAVLGCLFFHSFARWRPVVLIAVAVAGVGFYAMRDEMVDWLQNYADESKEGETFVRINGVQYPYSGTKHRDLLEIVYAEALQNVDLFGYGTQLRKAPRDPDMDKRFISIDNHYMMFELQYGSVGLTMFAILAASIVWNLVGPFLKAPGSPGRLAAGLFGGIVGCLVAMRSVWFAPDYAFLWLFCGGLSVALSRWYRAARAAGVYHLT